MFGDLFHRITSHFRKEQEIQLDPQLANQILSNAYEACEYEKNTIPLEILTSYSNYRKERFLFQKTILAFCAVAFLLLPILFVAPKFSITQITGETPGKPAIEVRLQNLIPMDHINASMDGVKMPVYEMADGTYQIIPDRNGELIVSVELWNQQQLNKSFSVSGVDSEPPVLLSSEQTEGNLILYFSDNSGALDVENTYASTMSGEIFKPVFYDAETLSVGFAYPAENINISVSDQSGNVLNIVVTLK